MTGTTITSGVLDAAIRFAAQGVLVYPVNGATKRPATPHGFKDASADPAVVADWFGVAGRFARCGLGYATGATSGAWTLDVDAGHGGHAVLAALELRHGRLPETATASTPSGGLHLHFRHPGASVRNSQGAIGPGLDVRGDASCVALPPTRRPDGRSYSWLRPWESLAVAPDWLLHLVVERPRPPRPVAPVAVTPAGGTRYGAVALLRELARVRESRNGTRNPALNRAAYSLAGLIAGGEIDPAGVEQSLLAAALDAGLGEREALSTIASGFRAGLRAPRRAPVRASAR